MNNVTDLILTNETARFGGKAVNLARLHAMGMRVPAGFVVDAAGVPLGRPLQQAVMAAFDKLGAAYVAVRSSAVNEDGSGAAWAGQLDTFLNVTRGQLLVRIEKCVRSAESERAKAYAEQKQLAAGSVAVIVQAMIDSEVSGVAFSAHPVSGSREQLVIEAGLGLGEAIVSGEITPDTYIVEAETARIVERSISAQTKILKRLADGSTGWLAIEPVAVEPKLSNNQVNELSQVLRNIAEQYGYPVDIEWAYANGALYILQARPITTL